MVREAIWEVRGRAGGQAGEEGGKATLVQERINQLTYFQLPNDKTFAIGIQWV